ncbi:hypothetical protein Tco_0128418 [Tanacetum coccineum]
MIYCGCWLSDPWNILSRKCSCEPMVGELVNYVVSFELFGHVQIALLVCPDDLASITDDNGTRSKRLQSIENSPQDKSSIRKRGKIA